MVDIVPEHVEASRTSGLEISGPGRASRRFVPACPAEEVDGRFDVIVLAVKAQATEAAMQALLPHLSPGGYVLSAQNGLNELTIARWPVRSARWGAS